MFLQKAYGKGTITAACALLMYFLWLSIKVLLRVHLVLIRFSFLIWPRIVGWFSIRCWAFTFCIYCEYTG